MIEQIDLQLSNHQLMNLDDDHFPGQQYLSGQNQYEFDDLLQPITTQTKFNQKKQKVTQQNLHHQHKTNESKYSPARYSPNKFVQDEQTKKFKSYLNEKVNQLKKSQQLVKMTKNQSKQVNPFKQSNQNHQGKNNNLRKIINHQENKNVQNQKQKQKVKIKKSIEEKTLSLNLIHQSQKKKTIQPGQTTKSSQNNQKNQIHQQKRFSNSHSNLMRDQTEQQKKNQQRKSSEINSKTPKLPSLTPNLKLPNIPTSHQKKDNSEKLINGSQKQTKQSFNTRESLLNNHFVEKISLSVETSNNFRVKKGSTNTLIDEKNYKKDEQIERKQKDKVLQSPIFVSKNKKMRQEFARLNEEQKILQMDIFKYHNQTKKFLQKIIKKYQLNGQEYLKYGIKKQIQQQKQKQSHNESKIGQNISKSPSKKNIEEKKPDNNKGGESPLKKQQKFNVFVDQEISKIDSILKSKQKQIKKLQLKLQKNSYIQFLKEIPQIPQDIAEIYQQNLSEQDKVNELPTNLQNQSKKQGIILGKTYGEVMNEMRKKKWGLNQRITFQTHRQSQQKSQIIKIKQDRSPLKQYNSKNQTNVQQIDSSNKIAVNSRLKNLLLD